MLDCKFLAPRKGRRGVGAGVDARDELADFPLTPFTAGEGDFLTPHEPTGLGAGDAFVLAKEGKSPSDKRLGGVVVFLERRFEGGVTGCSASASN